MTEKPSEAYLAGCFFGRDGRRFDAVGVEIKAYGKGFVDGRRTARAAEDWAKATEQSRQQLIAGTLHDKTKIDPGECQTRSLDGGRL